MDLSADTFQEEILEAQKAYDKYVICLEKPTDDLKSDLSSLMEKAIKAYVSRGPHLRHGIALNKQVTIILSQADTERPLCGIYFNLHSPYKTKKSPGAKARKEELP